MPSERLDRVLDDIAAYHGDAEFCVISGDLSDDGDSAAYRWLAERLASFPLPTVLMIGNHDDRAAMRANLPGLMDDGKGFVQGKRETAAGTFIFLDTFKGGTSAGMLCEARRAWLSRALERAEGPVWIIMHHPPFPIGIPYMDRIALDEPEALAALLAGHDVRHIFFGHVHRPVFRTWRGITASALPGINHQVPLVRGSVATPYDIEPPMYAVVHVDEDVVVINLDAPLDRRPADMPARTG